MVMSFPYALVYEDTRLPTSLQPYESVASDHEGSYLSHIPVMKIGSQRIIKPGGSSSQINNSCDRIFYTMKAPRAWEFTIIRCGADVRWLEILDNQIENNAPTSPRQNIIVGLNEKFDIIREHLAFNKTEWAEIFGVSRVTIYSWIKHSMEPLKENAERINALFHLATCLAALVPGEFIARNYLIQPFDLLGTSLLELFKGPIKQIQMEEKLPDLLRTLSEKSKQQANRLKKCTDESEYRDWNLDYNLRMLMK